VAILLARDVADGLDDDLYGDDREIAASARSAGAWPWSNGFSPCARGSV